MIEQAATVYVVDDDRAARESVIAMVGLKGLPAQGFGSAEEFLAFYDASRTGCLVVDVRMQGMSGLQLQQELKSRGCTLPVIVITGYADVPMAVRAMQNGAVTFLEKPCQEHELWRGIERALNQEQAQQTLRRQRAEIETRMNTLTSDEVVVMRKLLEGLPNKRIAADLDIGLRTVELRRSNIMRKMEADSLSELVQMAILINFLTPSIH
ncbi:two component transcriptional regulator, LuxR family [Pirellula staleyi DSM 6068]|uniref:Two component transcriptional regulator, LuxR family n=1 Tax=Pirellula staleyi (strain ATCC 27377 / DSM 6068 / ICPB 4128) TaxID=530564 RepID=D2R8D7_PIRSD|nr:response regulator [Pirellula staleyi]ADB15754.1 two component transcriptional regulator, LuxR family [Pirellula staleyi DSM 6068]